MINVKNHQQCPRRVENGQKGISGEDHPFKLPDDDEWRDGQYCSYCGSLRPRTFLDAIKNRRVLVGTTRKDYKAYATFALDAADYPTGVERRSKVYFQHFNDDERKEFLGLLNQRVVKFEGGIGFEVLPFFISSKCGGDEKKS